MGHKESNQTNHLTNGWIVSNYCGWKSNLVDPDLPKMFDWTDRYVQQVSRPPVPSLDPRMVQAGKL